MKQIKTIFATFILMAPISATSIVSAGTRNETPVQKVQSAFNSYFQNASHVNWMASGKESIVKFIINNNAVMATFSAKGKLLSAYRTIDATQLPFNVYLELNSQYRGNEVRHIVEYSDQDSHFYVITLENKTQWTKLKADGTGELNLIEQFNKV